MRALVEAEEVRCGLSTGGWCAAGGERDDGEEMPFGHWELDAGVSKTASGGECGAAAREREGVKVLQRAGHDGEEVAAGGGSGCRGTRGRSHQGREKKSRLGGKDAWRCAAAGGGARVVCAGGERRWQCGADGEAARPEEEEAESCQED
jgi:hypothetical protein